MLQKLLFGIFLLWFISCGNDNSKFVGEWTDKNHENEFLKISKVKKNLLVESYTSKSRGLESSTNNKYPAKVIDNMIEISAELPIKGIIDDNDNLIINGKEYVRFEKSKKSSFVGKWKSIYFVSNGNKEMPFEYKTGISGYLNFNSDFTVNCEFEFVETDKSKNFNRNINCEDLVGLFGNFNSMYFEDGVFKTGYEDKIINFSIENDFLKIKSSQDSDFSLFKKE